jgi:NAD(P)-dependent dehydrogenase (short-subunit alcohol dehydrogenase family)
MAQKVWMITGAARGLGAEIAKAALAAGEKVIATGRGKDGLNFSSDQDALFPVEMDVTNEAQVKSGVREYKPGSVYSLAVLSVIVGLLPLGQITAEPHLGSPLKAAPRRDWSQCIQSE